jgi:hypothetical protein
VNTGAWMRGNLTTQGYCIFDSEARALWLGLRFSTGAWLAVVAGLFAVGANIAALVLGLLLVAACTTVTANRKELRTA